MGWVTIRLPFYCEPIAVEHRFNGLVGNVFVEDSTDLICSVHVDENRAVNVVLSQEWVTELGVAIDPALHLEWAKLTEKERTARRVKPYVTLTVTLPGPGNTPVKHPPCVSWSWRGDGHYDGVKVLHKP